MWNVASVMLWQDLSVECGICYAYRLAGCVPELTCDDPRCRQTFHRDCLYEVSPHVTQS